MAYLDLLNDTCTIQRDAVGGPNAYGWPVPAWADHLLLEPCRIQTGVGREVKVGAEVVIADYKLFLDDVDITEQDRVIINGVTYEVLLVSDKQDWPGNHHKECLMRTVR